MKSLGIFFVTLLVSAGCTARNTQTRATGSHHHTTRRPYINLLDGCSHDEARLLARRSLKQRYGYDPDSAVDIADKAETENDWIFKTIGYFDCSDEFIIVSKTNGFVRWEYEE